MAKKKVAPEVEINAEVKVKKTRVSVKKKDKKVDVVVDTPKVDVEVTKTNEGTKVTVEAQTPVLKRVGKWVAHMMSKKFNRLKK